MIVDLNEIICELIESSENEELEIVLSNMIEHGLNLDSQNKDGDTLLIAAIRINYKDLINVMVGRFELYIDRQNNNQETALIEAAKSQDLETVKALLKNGANPHIVDHHGKTALAYVLEYENKNFSLANNDNYKESELLDILKHATNIEIKYTPFTQDEYTILKIEDDIRCSIQGWEKWFLDYLSTLRGEKIIGITCHEFYKKEITSLIEEYKGKEYYNNFVDYYSNDEHIKELYTPGKYLLEMSTDTIKLLANPDNNIKDAFLGILSCTEQESSLFEHIYNGLELNGENQRKRALHQLYTAEENLELPEAKAAYVENSTTPYKRTLDCDSYPSTKFHKTEALYSSELAQEQNIDYITDISNLVGDDWDTVLAGLL